MHTIVCFIRFGAEIRLQQVGTTYYLTYGDKKRKPITRDLGEYIISTYNPGQLQPNSRYS